VSSVPPVATTETIGTLRRRIAADLTQAFAARGHDGTPR
jgi:hypothetical protein